jgi:hypothetical protein
MLPAEPSPYAHRTRAAGQPTCSMISISSSVR